MKQFIEQLNERICVLEDIIHRKEAEIEKAPKGVINIVPSKNRVQYYYKSNSSDSVRMYMKKKDENLVRELCQRDYDEKVLWMSKKELQQLKKVYRHLQKGSWEDIYEQLGDYRKELVCPLRLPDEEYVANCYCSLSNKTLAVLLRKNVI